MLQIIIDNGHGNDTKGKQSPVWSDGSQLLEWEFNRKVARRVCSLLDSKGITYDLLVPENTDIPLSQRVQRANHIANVNGKKNCLLVSIHANAGGGTGWEIHTSKGTTQSDKYAEIFFEEASLAFPEFRMRYDISDGDHDWDSDFSIISRTLCPAVLTENFFMDNERDCRFIMSEEGVERIAQMHFKAILRCIELQRTIKK